MGEIWVTIPFLLLHRQSPHLLAHSTIVKVLILGFAPSEAVKLTVLQTVDPL